MHQRRRRNQPNKRHNINSRTRREKTKHGTRKSPKPERKTRETKRTTLNTRRTRRKKTKHGIRTSPTQGRNPARNLIRRRHSGEQNMSPRNKTYSGLTIQCPPSTRSLTNTVLSPLLLISNFAVPTYK